MQGDDLGRDEVLSRDDIIEMGIRVWPPFYVYDDFVECACYKVDADYFMVTGSEAASGPFRSLESAIRESGEIAPLIWLEGETVLLHLSSEPDDGRSSGRRVLRRNEEFLAVDREGEFLDGPYHSLESAAESIHAFDVTKQSRSIASSLLGTDEIIARLRVSEWEPDVHNTVDVNGSTVRLRDIVRTRESNH